MSIFKSIAEAIFGGPANAAPVTDPATSGAPQLPSGSLPPLDLPPLAGTPVAGSAPGTPAPQSGPPPLPPSAQAPASREAIAALLDRRTEQRGEDDIDWRKSIVDLMKLLDLDSSLKARKSLAQELGYSGDMNDSAKMNIWLHRQVMSKLTETGGKPPYALAS